MFVVISPSKTMDESPLKKQMETHDPLFNDKAFEIMNILKKKKKKELMSIMKISEKLADQTNMRIQNFGSLELQSKPAIFSYSGEVFSGLNAQTFSPKDIVFADTHLRILSAVYGILKPMDAIYPYRLEMSATSISKNIKSMYSYWNNAIAEMIEKEIQSHEQKLVVNLASEEYFKILSPYLVSEVLHISFKEFRNGKLSFVSTNAKKARGLMARFIIQNRIETKEKLKIFNVDGYSFSKDDSDDHFYQFTRVV